MLLTRDPDDDPVVAALVGESEFGVMDEPAKGHLDERQVVLGDDGLDELERVKRGVLEVSLSAEFSETGSSSVSSVSAVSSVVSSVVSVVSSIS